MKEMKTLTINGVTYTVADPDAAHINDGEISSDATWSSKKIDSVLGEKEVSIIDKLCPAFTKSGAIVTCEPVAGYPLTVAAQDGTTRITRCGKNLIPYPYPYSTLPGGGVTFTDNGDGSITLNGTITESYGFTLAELNTPAKRTILKDGVSYRISGSSTLDAMVYLSFKDESGSTVYWYSARGVLVWKEAYTNVRIYIQTNTVGATFDNFTIYPQLEAGEASTAYEPYQAEAFTPGTQIPALSGVNTLYADVGEITVSGRADPRAVMDSVLERVAALEAKGVAENA